MSDLAEQIDVLQRRLGVHRRTLDFLEIQRAQLGAFTPTYIWHQFDEARSEIAQIKRELRAFGVAVDDRPSDATEHPSGSVATSAPNQQGLLQVYQRILIDQTRFLSLRGLSRWGDGHAKLADVYVERTLLPIGSTADHAPDGATLSALAQQAGVRLLVEGDAGSGKTICLNMLALACVTQSMGEGGDADFGAGWTEPPPLPILLSASEIALALARTDAALQDGSLPTLPVFWDAIEEWLRYSDLASMVPSMQQLLERGGCLIMIDGLDDLPPAASRNAFVTALTRFIARYPENRFIITHRGRDIAQFSSLATFQRYALPRLDEGRIDAFVERWYAAVADRAGLFLPEDVRSRIAAVQAMMHNDSRLVGMARQPLSLVLCVLAHAEGVVLPTERSLVLMRLARILVAGRGQSSPDAELLAGDPADVYVLGTGERLDVLAPLGLAFQSRSVAKRDQTAALTHAEVAAEIGSALAALHVEQNRKAALIQQVIAACCRYGLLLASAQDTYTMPQVQARDFLAALALINRPNFSSHAYSLRFEHTRRETLLLALHQLRYRSTPHIGRLLVRLLLHGPEGAEPSHDDVMFAAECLAEVSDASRSDNALLAEVQERLLELLATNGLPIADRVRAGTLLGQLGDRRFGGLLPPLARVEGGTFLVGTNDGYEDEGPQQWIMAATFAIGIHPVTNHEYAQFLTAHPEQTHPRYWHDLRFNNPTAPVVGITWHEANAYCAWLSAELHDIGALEKDLLVRLPTEFEWEKAASWDAATETKRRYPWGDEWDSERANTADQRGEWLTVPVGCYPSGASPYGVEDCIGNVWEWTASQYSSYRGAVHPVQENGSYTLRGSSCMSNPTHARCTYRSRLPAGYWRYHLGFRIVIGAPLVVG